MGNGALGVVEGVTVRPARAAGLYLVRTDFWYVERTGWLIAGVSVVGGTLAAWLLSREFILLIAACSFSSILASLTGFCPMGNVLYAMGVRPLLNAGEGRWYFMRTDSWYLERRIYLMVGVNLTVGTVLVYVHSPYWLLYTGFVGTACVFFALSGFCIMAHLLYRKGKEPRLQRRV